MPPKEIYTNWLLLGGRIGTAVGLKAKASALVCLQQAIRNLFCELSAWFAVLFQLPLFSNLALHTLPANDDLTTTIHMGSHMSRANSSPGLSSLLKCCYEKVFFLLRLSYLFSHIFLWKVVHFSYGSKANTAATVTTDPGATLLLVLVQLPILTLVSFAIKKIKDALRAIGSLPFISQKRWRDTSAWAVMKAKQG